MASDLSMLTWSAASPTGRTEGYLTLGTCPCPRVQHVPHQTRNSRFPALPEVFNQGRLAAPRRTLEDPERGRPLGAPIQRVERTLEMPHLGVSAGKERRDIPVAQIDELACLVVEAHRTSLAGACRETGTGTGCGRLPRYESRVRRLAAGRRPCGARTATVRLAGTSGSSGRPQGSPLRSRRAFGVVAHRRSVCTLSPPRDQDRPAQSECARR